MAEKSFKYVIVGGGVSAVSFSIIGSRTFPSSISLSRSDSFSCRFIRFPVLIPKFSWNIGPLVIFWFMFLSLWFRILNNRSEPCNLVLAWFVLHTDLNVIFSPILFLFFLAFSVNYMLYVLFLAEKYFL
jgi:hypothetical protein